MGGVSDRHFVLLNCWASDAILDPMVICLLGVESNSKTDPEGQGKGNRGVSRAWPGTAPIAILCGGLASSWVFLPGAGTHVKATDALKRSYKMSLYCESK